MAQIAYSIETAAIAASVMESDIAAAIQIGDLTARRLRAEPIILGTDLQVWLESLAKF